MRMTDEEVNALLAPVLEAALRAARARSAR